MDNLLITDDCHAGCWATPAFNDNSDGLLHWLADWDEGGAACEKYPRSAGWIGTICYKPKAGYCTDCMRIYNGKSSPGESCGTWLVTMSGVEMDVRT